MSTTRDTNTASDSLIRLKTSLSVSISSLKARNDKLESHLKRTGWTIRPMTPQKHEYERQILTIFPQWNA